MAALATLTDNFNSATNDATKWAPFATGTSTQARSNGQVVFTPPNATAGSNYAGYDSAASFDLTGSYAYVQIPTMVNTATHAQCYLKLSLNSSNYVQLVQEFGTFKAQKDVGGATADVAGGITYSSSAHQWWRIREASGTIFFDYATNGITWTNFTSLLNPFAVTAMTVEFAAGTYQSEASPGSARFDNFNTLGGNHNLMLLGVGS